MEYYKFDLHTHSHYSWDGHEPVTVMVRRARHIGLSVLAITDHDDNRSHKEVKRFDLKKHQVLVLPGIEYSAKEGHVVGIGWLTPLEKGTPAQSVVEHIHEEGGLAFLPHPFDFLRSGAGGIGHTIGVDAIEVMNASSLLPLPNARAKRYARKHGFPMLGNSDAHRSSEIGTAFTVSLELPESMDELFDVIRRDQVKEGGHRIGVIRKTSRFLRRKFRRTHPLHENNEKNQEDDERTE